MGLKAYALDTKFSARTNDLMAQFYASLSEDIASTEAAFRREAGYGPDDGPTRNATMNLVRLTTALVLMNTAEAAMTQVESDDFHAQQHLQAWAGAWASAILSITRSMPPELRQLFLRHFDKGLRKAR